MKKSWKKVVLVLLGVLLAIILSLVIYFYLALEGNPLVRWQERREVLGIFEEAYVADFSWDVREVDAAEVDAILEELTERIEDGLGLLSMEIKVRVGVYDGREYYFNDRLIER